MIEFNTQEDLHTISNYQGCPLSDEKINRLSREIEEKSKSQTALYLHLLLIRFDMEHENEKKTKNGI